MSPATSPATRTLPSRIVPEAALTPPDPAQVILDAVPRIGGDGRYGDRKVFIAAIYDRVGARLGLTLDQLKRLILDLNRQRILTLARADLVAAMPPDMVRRSETSDRGASFHFVVDPTVTGGY